MIQTYDNVMFGDSRPLTELLDKLSNERKFDQILTYGDLKVDDDYNQFICMDTNPETSIFNINQLRTALGRLDLNEVATRTIELAEDYMPGCAWLDSQGGVQFAETLAEVEGLVLCSSREQHEDSPDEVPFWVASWLDELFPDIAERLRTALAEATWGTSAPEVG